MTWLYERVLTATPTSLASGSTSHPWSSGMWSRSKMISSSVYSKSETPVNRTFTSRPVASRGNTAIASLTLCWRSRGLLEKNEENGKDEEEDEQETYGVI